MKNNVIDINFMKWVEFDNRMRWEVSLYLMRREWLFGQEVVDFINSLIYTYPSEYRNEKEEFMNEAVEFNRRFEKERDERMEREAEINGEMEELIAHRLIMGLLKDLSTK